MLEIPHNTGEVALMKEKLEFAVFKLERTTDKYSQYVALEEQVAAHHLYTEQKFRADIVLDDFVNNSSYYSKESKPIIRLPSRNSRNTTNPST